MMKLLGIKDWIRDRNRVAQEKEKINIENCLLVQLACSCFPHRSRRVNDYSHFGQIGHAGLHTHSPRMLRYIDHAELDTYSPRIRKRSLIQTHFRSHRKR